jgi:hypothetical protein
MNWPLGSRAMIGSLVIAHIWGTALVVAVFMGKESLVIGQMFEGVGFMIFTTLGVLVGGKAWKDFAPMKWGSGGTVITQTETKVEKSDV